MMVALLTLAMCGCVTQTSNEALLQKLQKSTVSVDSDGGRCSGWVLKGTHTVVTAAHCKGDNMKVDLGTGKYYPLTVTKMGDEDWHGGPDLMTLTSNDPQVPWPDGLPICPFPAYYGEELALFGQPLGVKNEILFGRVSLPAHSVSDRTFIGFSQSVYPGNSGGAAVDLEQKCVMGVADFIQTVQPGLAYGLNFLTPANQLTEL